MKWMLGNQRSCVLLSFVLLMEEVGSAVKSAVYPRRTEKDTSELSSGPKTEELPTYSKLCGASAPGLM